jgi:hypothetical protein
MSSAQDETVADDGVMDITVIRKTSRSCEQALRMIYEVVMNDGRRDTQNVPLLLTWIMK